MKGKETFNELVGELIFRKRESFMLSQQELADEVRNEENADGASCGAPMVPDDQAG